MKSKSLTYSFTSVFCMELSMLLHSGIALNEGILTLLDDETDKDGRIVLQSLLAPLEEGEPLSVSLEGSGYFPRYMVKMVGIGEKTGRLTETLEALAEYYNRQDSLSATIRNAVFYPVILLVIMVAVVLILIVQVLPMFDDVFTRMGTQMSALASALMRFGGWLRGAATGIAVVFGVILLVALIAWIVPRFRSGLSAAFLNKWGGSGIFGKVSSARFTSVMALAVASGLDAEEAVSMAADVSGGSSAINKRHEKCVALLHEGRSMSEAMRESGILSAQNGRILSIGTRSGMTDAAMAEIARRSDRTVQEDIERIVSRVEPSLVIAASVIVGVILLSVMLPLMGIMSSLG